jgi:hypothetical protein
MRKRFEARQQARMQQLEEMLARREERLAEITQRQQELRDELMGERDYLSEHHQELLDMALQRKEEQIKRHEQLIKQAEERRARYAQYRAEMQDMDPDELGDYLDERIMELAKEMEEKQPAYTPQPGYAPAPMHHRPMEWPQWPMRGPGGYPQRP